MAATKDEIRGWIAEEFKRPDGFSEKFMLEKVNEFTKSMKMKELSALWMHLNFLRRDLENQEETDTVKPLKMYKAMAKHGMSIVTVFAEDVFDARDKIAETLSRRGREVALRKWMDNNGIVEEVHGVAGN